MEKENQLLMVEESLTKQDEKIDLKLLIEEIKQELSQKE